MSLSVSFRHSARAEFIEAAAWYESERQNLGVEFIAEIERCVAAAEPGSDGRLPQRAASKRRATVRPNRHGTQVVEYPSELEIVTTRMFDAPVGLVFDVLTKPEHVRRWAATGGDRMTICEIDLRVGGDFHHVFVTPDGRECSFRGTYLEIEPPSRVVNTWLFEGWKDAWATETNALSEVGGVTTLMLTLAFRDKEGASNMLRAHADAARRGDTNGQPASFDAMEDLLSSLLEQESAPESGGVIG